jgi:pathogenesis-related protein 1
MRTRNAAVLLLSLLVAPSSTTTAQSLGPGASVDRPPVGVTGSDLTAKEAAALVEFHNRAREQVGVPPVNWSRTLARFAQEWADKVAQTGKLVHRTWDDQSQPRFGENIAWGLGDAYGVLSAAEHWQSEVKLYEPGTPIPENFGDFKALHYTQMVWKNTRAIGAGKAIIEQGDKKGWMVVVCNYNPPGNVIGEKPY